MVVSSVGNVSVNRLFIAAAAKVFDSFGSSPVMGFSIGFGWPIGCYSADKARLACVCHFSAGGERSLLVLLPSKIAGDHHVII